jgi:hypothetical protein
MAIEIEKKWQFSVGKMIGETLCVKNATGDL